MIYLHRDEFVNKLLRATFPEYKGNKISVQVKSTIRFIGTQWDDGSRTEYRVVRLADLTLASIETEPFMERSKLHETEYTIPSGTVVVALVTFCGRDRIEITSPGGNLTPALEAPCVLTEDESIVLKVTSGYKSSYAGIKDYRLSMSGIGSERYNVAKQALIRKGLLSKNGAISIRGKNVLFSNGTRV